MTTKNHVPPPCPRGLSQPGFEDIIDLDSSPTTPENPTSLTEVVTTGITEEVTTGGTEVHTTTPDLHYQNGQNENIAVAAPQAILSQYTVEMQMDMEMEMERQLLHTGLGLGDDIGQLLSIHEEDMLAWIDYPLDNFFDGILLDDSTPPPPDFNITQQTTVVSDVSQLVARASPPLENFTHLANLEAQTESRVSQVDKGKSVVDTVDLTMLPSSSNGSRASLPSKKKRKQPAKKQPEPNAEEKGKEKKDESSSSEDSEVEAAARRRQATAKRSRSAVHNQSERNRRNKISGKLRTLQQIIPSCSTVDKASTLEDTIKFVNSSKRKMAKLLAEGCPGTNNKTPNPIDTGMAMNCQAASYPPVPNPAYIAPSYPMPAQYQTQQIQMPNPFMTHASNQADHSVNLNQYQIQLLQNLLDSSQYQTQPGMPNLVHPYQYQNQPRTPNLVDPNQYQNQPRMPNQSQNHLRIPNLIDLIQNPQLMLYFSNMFQQFLGIHQALFSFAQKQTESQPGAEEQSTEGNLDNQ